MGFSNSADKAGESVNALKADINMEIAIVTANCWNKVPVIPGKSTEGKIGRAHV